MNNQRGVVVLAVVFLGLFALGLGALVGHKAPGIFNGCEESQPK